MAVRLELKHPEIKLRITRATGFKARRMKKNHRLRHAQKDLLQQKRSGILPRHRPEERLSARSRTPGAKTCILGKWRDSSGAWSA